MNTKLKERIGKIFFATSAVICIIAVVAIFAFMLIKSIPALNKIGFFQFVTGDVWSPDRLDKLDSPTLAGSYGIFKMIISTLAATAGALLIGGSLGYFTAVFISFYCPKKLKKVFSSVINLLAGIPSVVYGFFGIVFLLPLLANFASNNGSGLLATSLILGIMIMPTIVSLSVTSFNAVPRSFYEGALAIGATHTGAVFGVMTRAARSGVTASLVLGIGRALGETMAVVMVAGNSVAYPQSLFNSFRVMTANIVMEMGYAGEVQQGALVATGVILLLFVTLVNVIFSVISKKAVSKITSQSSKKSNYKNPSVANVKLRKYISAFQDARQRVRYLLNTPNIGKVASIGAGVTSAVVLVLVIGFILVKGTPFLIQNPSLLFGKYKFDSEQVTILPSIVTTLMTVFLSLIIAIPIGIGTAIFLNEYAPKKSWIVKVIQGAIDILNGVPSIVYGLFGMITFVALVNGTSSILAGSLTVSIMLLPTIVRSTQESLKSVEGGLREGSFALGAGKLRTIFSVVLPSAMPGIVSAIILSMGRVISESAPFIYTMGSVISAVPSSYLDSNATLAVALYRLSGEGWYVNEAYATAVVLIVVVLVLNLLAELIASRLNRRLKGEKR